MALVIYGNVELRQTQKEAARQEAAALSRLVAAYEESYIKTTRQLLATLNQFSFLVLSSNKSFCETNFINLRLLYPDYKNFGLIETNGQLFCSAEPDRPAVNLKDRTYFQRVLRSGDFAMGDFQVGRITGQPGLNFGFPVRDEKQQLRRVLYASLKLSRLSEPLKKMGLPAGATIMILDQNGSVLAREPESELWVGKSLTNTPAIQAILGHRSGVMELEGVDKISRLYATTVVGDGKSANFYVSVGIPSAVSFARANRILVKTSFCSYSPESSSPCWHDHTHYGISWGPFKNWSF